MIDLFGDYTWANGIKSLVMLFLSEENAYQPLFDLANDRELTYPHTDFRQKYSGSTKEGCIHHGEGILTLKNGKTYEGKWKNGILNKFKDELNEEKQEYLNEENEEKEKMPS